MGKRIQETYINQDQMNIKLAPQKPFYHLIYRYC